MLLFLLQPEQHLSQSSEGTFVLLLISDLLSSDHCWFLTGF